MCNFLSGLVLKNGDFLSHPMLDSHADLVTYFKLPDDDTYLSRFAKAELRPKDWMDAETWDWAIDEGTRPAWLDEVEATAEAAARARASRMIVRTGEHQLIVDGCWIVGGDAVVRDMRAGRIMFVWGSAQIHNVGGSAQIHGVWGSAQIHNVGGSAQIHNVGDSAQIHNVRDSAQLDDSAKAHVVAS